MVLHRRTAIYTVSGVEVAEANALTRESGEGLCTFAHMTKSTRYKRKSFKTFRGEKGITVKGKVGI